MPGRTNYSSVLVTCGSIENAKVIAKDLVEKKLAACANIWNAASVYRWEGKIEESDEVMILLKVRTEDFPKVRDEVERLHEYEVPCIVRYDIAEGLETYLLWLEDSTDR